MGLFSSFRGNFELAEKGSDRKIEITREELMRVAHAVRFYRDNEADLFDTEYDSIYKKLDKILD